VVAESSGGGARSADFGATGRSVFPARQRNRLGLILLRVRRLIARGHPMFYRAVLHRLRHAMELLRLSNWIASRSRKKGRQGLLGYWHGMIRIESLKRSHCIRRTRCCCVRGADLRPRRTVHPTAPPGQSVESVGVGAFVHPHLSHSVNDYCDHALQL